MDLAQLPGKWSDCSQLKKNSACLWSSTRKSREQELVCSVAWLKVSVGMALGPVHERKELFMDGGEEPTAYHRYRLPLSLTRWRHSGQDLTKNALGWPVYQRIETADQHNGVHCPATCAFRSCLRHLIKDCIMSLTKRLSWRFLSYLWGQLKSGVVRKYGLRRWVEGKRQSTFSSMPASKVFSSHFKILCPFLLTPDYPHHVKKLLRWQFFPFLQKVCLQK